MLCFTSMKTLIASSILALATSAFAGPDFTLRSPRAHSLAASPASSEIGPIDDVVFATNSTRLTDSAHTQIATVARWLRVNPSQRIVVEGYADSVGYALYNEDLATRRADAVRQLLMRHGVPSDRIITVVYGEHVAVGGEHPLDRRVVMYATRLEPKQIAAASFRHRDALSATWTNGKALYIERRPGTVIGSR